jgi:hypothetical protein
MMPLPLLTNTCRAGKHRDCLPSDHWLGTAAFPFLLIVAGIFAGEDHTQGLRLRHRHRRRPAGAPLTVFLHGNRMRGARRTAGQVCGPSGTGTCVTASNLRRTACGRHRAVRQAAATAGTPAVGSGGDSRPLTAGAVTRARDRARILFACPGHLSRGCPRGFLQIRDFRPLRLWRASGAPLKKSREESTHGISQADHVLRRLTCDTPPPTDPRHPSADRGIVRCSSVLKLTNLHLPAVQEILPPVRGSAVPCSARIRRA